MIKFKNIFKGKTKGKENIKAKNEQIMHLIGFVIMGVFLYSFYHYTSTSKKIIKKEEVIFEGSFDDSFLKNSDLALIEKQQKELDEIKLVEENRLKKDEASKNEHLKEGSNTAVMIQSLQQKISHLESESKKTNEALQISLIKNKQEKKLQSLYPQGGEAEQLKKMQQSFEGEEKYKQQKAPMQTIKFNYKSDKEVERNASNYVWAGTFVSGVLLNGAKADAGVNGPKNAGLNTIRLTSNGDMPNGSHSRLKDCFVLASSYGDLSGDSVVMHLETLSCAGKKINLEKKVYGAVFDTDAMQDVRGTPILNTKPLLGYTAAAGLLAGLGDGIKSIGSAQSIGANGSFTNFPTDSVARGAVGGALTNPANKISDYVMKIADIYHPLVISRAGRKITIQFSKGFWIDKKHQVFESGRAIDNKAQTGSVGSMASSSGYKNTEQFKQLSNKTRETLTNSAREAGKQFLSDSDSSASPFFSSVNQ